MKILIDVGHGGSDSGAIGCYDDTEKRLNLLIAEYVHRELYNSYGVVSDMTRMDDTTVTLADRVDKANKGGYDLVISIHCNADGISEVNNDDSIKGTEIYHSVTSTNGNLLAKSILNEINNSGFTTKRGIKTRVGSNGRDYYYMIRCTKAECLIIESFFIDDADDYNCYIKRLDNLGKAIADGISKHYKLTKVQTNDTTYSVQVGAFRVKENAENLVTELKRQGYHAFIVSKS